LQRRTWHTCTPQTTTTGELLVVDVVAQSRCFVSNVCETAGSIDLHHLVYLHSANCDDWQGSQIFDDYSTQAGSAMVELWPSLNRSCGMMLANVMCQRVSPCCTLLDGDWHSKVNFLCACHALQVACAGGEGPQQGAD
jgi:hypothetical protein